MRKTCLRLYRQIDKWKSKSAKSIWSFFILFIAFFMFLHILLHFKHLIVFRIKCLPVPWVTCVIAYITLLLDIINFIKKIADKIACKWLWKKMQKKKKIVGVKTEVISIHYIRFITQNQHRGIYRIIIREAEFESAFQGDARTSTTNI